jgi:hypothetical protein
MTCENLMLVVGIYFACKVILLLLKVALAVIVAFMPAPRENSNEVAEIVNQFLHQR